MNIKKEFIDRFSKVVLIVLCSSLFVLYINEVSASNDTEFNFPDQISNSELATLQSGSNGGRYQMTMTTVARQDDSTLWYILVWDTQTGNSKFYYGSVAHGTKAAYSKFQLPASPL